MHQGTPPLSPLTCRIVLDPDYAGSGGARSCAIILIAHPITALTLGAHDFQHRDLAGDVAEHNGAVPHRRPMATTRAWREMVRLTDLSARRSAPA